MFLSFGFVRKIAYDIWNCWKRISFYLNLDSFKIVSSRLNVWMCEFWVCVCGFVEWIPLNIFLYIVNGIKFLVKKICFQWLVLHEKIKTMHYTKMNFSIRLNLCDFCFVLLICFYVSIFRRILFCFLKGRPLNMSKITQKWYGTKIFFFCFHHGHK